MQEHRIRVILLLHKCKKHISAVVLHLRILIQVLDESGALLGIIANRGIKGSEAGNSLQSTLVNLTKHSGESYKAMQALGLSAYDSEGKFKGVSNVLLELNDKTKNLTEEQRNNYLTMIAGKTQLTTLNALMSGLTTVASNGKTEFENLRAELQNSNGALDSMANTMTNILVVHWQEHSRQPMTLRLL